VTSLAVVIYIECLFAIVYRTIPLSIKDMLYWSLSFHFGVVDDYRVHKVEVLKKDEDLYRHKGPLS
jgi:hypothetical protein